jgi:hypothetical protein
MNIISFDPGQKGGIAIHHQCATTAHPMPLAGKVLDLASIATIIREASPLPVRSFWKRVKELSLTGLEM